MLLIQVRDKALLAAARVKQEWSKNKSCDADCKEVIRKLHLSDRKDSERTIVIVGGSTVGQYIPPFHICVAYTIVQEEPEVESVYIYPLRS